jgi:hypothetical protein
MYIISHLYVVKDFCSLKLWIKFEKFFEFFKFLKNFIF